MPKLNDAAQARVQHAPEASLAELIADRPEKTHVSFSELATFRDCPLKWLLKYGARLQGPERPLRLDRGTAWHSMLEAHYGAILAGMTKAATRNEVMLALNIYNEKIGGMEDGEFETLTWMYDDYVRIYGSDPEYLTVNIEEAFEFPMDVPGFPKLTIVGRIDHETIHEPTGRRQVWDHKSASGRDVSKDGYVSEMLLEDQFILYAAAKRLGGTPVHSVIYNVARTDKLKRKMLDSERYNRVKIHYPDAALDATWEDNRRAARALMEMWEDPTRQYSVPNPKQCGWKCDYQRAHIEARATGRDIAAVAIGYGFTVKPRSEGETVVELEPQTEEGGW